MERNTGISQLAEDPPQEGKAALMGKDRHGSDRFENLDLVARGCLSFHQTMGTAEVAGKDAEAAPESGAGIARRNKSQIDPMFSESLEKRDEGTGSRLPPGKVELHQFRA